MTPRELLARLRAQGANLRRDGDRLVCQAAKGVLSDDVRTALRQAKQEVLALLDEEQTQFVGQPTRPVRRPHDGEAPPSFVQQRLWYLYQVEAEPAVYNVPAAFRLTGSLHVPVLRRAIGEIVRRHEALRTTFAFTDGALVQRIHPPSEIELPLVDLSTCSALAAEREAQEALAAEARKPFDLAEGPLARFLLVRVRPNDHVLLLVAHHTTIDGWSLEVFWQELSALYGAFRAGSPTPLAELPLQYADYARWQRDTVLGERLEQQLAYWRRKLAGPLPALDLPADRPRPSVQTYRGDAVPFTLTGALTQSLTAVGRQEGATPFMVLLAGFQLLLHRLTGQEDLIVGTAVANRRELELEPLIGCFADTLAVRSTVSGAASFRDVLRSVRSASLDAFGNQDVSFERIVETVRPERDLSRTPIFQALFAFESAPVRSAPMGDLLMRRLPVHAGVSRTDVTLWLREDREGIAGLLEYSTDLFVRETIERIVAQFTTLLEGVAADPGAPIAAIPLMGAAERGWVVEGWNRTVQAGPGGGTVAALVEAQVGRTPAAVAVADGERALTYAELEGRANQLAAHLRGLGVGPDVLVGVCLERSVALVVGLLGVWKAGGAYVPLDPGYPAERLAYMLRDAGVGVVVTEAGLLERVPVPAGVRVVCVDRDAAQLAAEPTGRGAGGAGPADLAYVIYTSGSTGKPKGVQVPQGAVVNFLGSMAREPGLTAADVLVAVTTLSFDIAVLELWLPLVVGARVELARRAEVVDGRALRQRVEGSGATVMQATPATWRMLVEAGWAGGPGFTALCGGEALPRELAEQLLERVGALWNMYGPTETTVWSTCHRVREATGPIAIGRPIANTQVYVLDERREPVPIGVRGELYIGGAGVTRGYVGRPELTAERFVPDPFAAVPGARLYRTGDVARWRADGTVECLGRTDQQVKVRGFRIELGEIEAGLGTHAGVREAAVVVREDRPGDVRLVAYVVAPPGAAPTPSELRAHLRRTLPEYMIPQHVVALATLPRTPNGKLDRRAFPAPLNTTADAVSYAAPRTAAERLVAKVWQEVLGISQAGVHDNFFDLGGHSLLSLQAIARLEVRCGVRIEPRAMILETLGQIAARVTDAGNGGSEARSAGGEPRRVGMGHTRGVTQ